MISRMKKREKEETTRRQRGGRTKWVSGRKSKAEREGDEGTEKEREMGRRLP